MAVCQIVGAGALDTGLRPTLPETVHSGLNRNHEHDTHQTHPRGLQGQSQHSQVR